MDRVLNPADVLSTRVYIFRLSVHLKSTRVLTGSTRVYIFRLSVHLKSTRVLTGSTRVHIFSLSVHLKSTRVHFKYTRVYIFSSVRRLFCRALYGNLISAALSPEQKAKHLCDTRHKKQGLRVMETVIFPNTTRMQNETDDLPINPVAEDVSLEAQIWPDQPASSFWEPFRDRTWLSGLVMLLLGGVAFWGADGIDGRFGAGRESVFVINFAFMLIYSAVLMAEGRLSWFIFAKREHYPTYLLYLSMWLVSCFALNREIPVFQRSCDWLSIHLFLSVSVFVAGAWLNQFSPALRAVWYGAIAWSAVLFCYFAIYLLPLSAISTIVIWFFLIPFHAYIPLVISITLINILLHGWRAHRRVQFAIVAGLTIPLAITIGFVNDWYHRDYEIRSAFATALTEQGSGLPRWVLASQRLSRSTTGENWLKSEVLFEEGGFRGDFLPFISGASSKRHDPLIWIATALLPMPDITEDERTKILGTFFDKRHDLHDRLWSGQHLATSQVETYIEAYPELRMAYTEKKLTITNSGTSINGRPALQEEAFYTFNLPEGGAVTSLSLWINGQEEFSRLAARTTADSAYRTIVGREQRDPSLVHWQEGSTVTVRVFPCTNAEPRQFKIGVTAPLQETDEGLSYENITFRGPSAESAKSTLSIKTTAPPNTRPKFLRSNAEGIWQGSSAYRPDFTLQWAKIPVSETSFRFNHKKYSTSACTPVLEAFRPEIIYADVNRSWSGKELSQLLEMAGATPVYVWHEGAFCQLTRANRRKIAQVLCREAFSLFPYHLLPTEKAVVVVAKSAGATPILEDLRDSDFAKKAKERYAAQPQPIRVWHIGPDLSSYLRSLREFRLLHVSVGDWPTFAQLLQTGNFYQNPEQHGAVVIPNSGLQIVQSPDSLTGPPQGNTHLMRLFAYNDVLRQIGPRYFTPRYEPKELVRKAEEAFVVTPLSSLVVLETQADYERFGIDKNRDTLGNAADGGKGAVPEPDEWALLLTLALLTWVWWSRSKTAG